MKYTRTWSGLQGSGDFVMVVSLVEEIFREDRVNELHREVNPKRLIDVPEVLQVHEVPSDEVRMVPFEEVSIFPLPPTVTMVLFP